MPTPVLTHEQYQYTESGFLLNGNETPPFVDLTSIDGLDNAPVRQSNTTREGVDGAWVDAEFEDARVVTLEGSLYSLVTEVDQYLDTLKANFAPTRLPQPLYFGLDSGLGGGVRLVLAKSLGARFAKDTQRRLGIIPFQVQFICEDPRIYSAEPVVQALPGNLVLSGNRGSTGIITITSTNCTLNIGTTSMVFTGLTGTTTVDLDKHTVVTAGANARSKLTLTGLWPKLVPGANIFTGSGVASVSARSAWR